MHDKTALNTMQEICAYTGKSESTLRRLIKEESFPAIKEGGQWASDKTVIDDWRRKRLHTGQAA